MENTFNINRKIRVVLTKDGAEAINKTNNDEINEYLAMFPNADTNFLKTDYAEGDVIEDSLWYLFTRLGTYFRGHTNAPFVNNEITIIED